jgi:hypothetical protein
MIAYLTIKKESIVGIAENMSKNMTLDMCVSMKPTTRTVYLP